MRRVLEVSAPREHSRGASLWPLAGFTALSLLVFGLPVLGRLGSRAIAADTLDSSQFMWFFAWWPHALLHGLNPWVSHAMFAPEGINLTWSTSMPGPSLLLAPVTLLFGPVVSWNVIQLASPAVSAWTMFLLCRHVTGKAWPSAAGGYVYGFSPYVLAHLTGGPYLALVPLLPLLVLLVVRSVQGTISDRRFVALTALCLSGQYLISSEVLATATLFGAIGGLIAYSLLKADRGALRRTAGLSVLAYGATLVLVSPFLYYFFFGVQRPPGVTFFSADVASFITPPPLVALAPHGTPFRGANTEAYLGAPFVLLLALFAYRERRSRPAWVLVGSLLVAAILSLGAHLFIRGRLTKIPGPWLPLSHLPVLRYAVPLRFAVFIVLPGALIVALWLAGRAPSGAGPARRWVLVCLVIVTIAPAAGNAAWNTRVVDPPFFRSSTYRSYLAPGARVLTIPAKGPGERWQADTGFRFDLADGDGGNPQPSTYTRFAAWNTLITGQLGPGYRAQLRRFIAAKGVTDVVVDESVPGPWRQLFGTLGVRPISTGGVLLYHLRR